MNKLNKEDYLALSEFGRNAYRKELALHRKHMRSYVKGMMAAFTSKRMGHILNHPKDAQALRAFPFAYAKEFSRLNDLSNVCKFDAKKDNESPLFDLSSLAFKPEGPQPLPQYAKDILAQ